MAIAQNPLTGQMRKAMGNFWKRGSRHVVNKTRIVHICENCKGTIPKGSEALYRNAFTGKRVYQHCFKSECRTVINKNMENKSG